MLATNEKCPDERYRRISMPVPIRCTLYTRSVYIILIFRPYACLPPLAHLQFDNEIVEFSQMHATKSIVRRNFSHVFHYRTRSLTIKRFKCITISQNRHFHRESINIETISEVTNKNQFERKFSHAEFIFFDSFLVACPVVVGLKCHWKFSHFTRLRSKFSFSFSPQHYMESSIALSAIVVCFDIIPR